MRAVLQHPVQGTSVDSQTDLLAAANSLEVDWSPTWELYEQSTDNVCPTIEAKAIVLSKSIQRTKQMVLQFSLQAT